MAAVAQAFNDLFRLLRDAGAARPRRQVARPTTAVAPTGRTVAWSIDTPHPLALGTLAVRLAVIRPRLTRRSNRILAGKDTPRSHGHHAYVALEMVKIVALATGSIILLAA